MEIQVLAVFLPLQCKLPCHGFLVNAYSHAAQLYAAFQDWIPYQEVAVQPFVSVFVWRAPVVVVWCPQVMFFAIAQLAAYSNYEHGAIFLAYQVLSFLCCLVGVHP